MPTYVEYTLEDGSKLLVEVEEAAGGIVKAARKDGNLVAPSETQFKEALGGIRGSASALQEELDALKCEEAEIKFGLKVIGEAGVFAVGKLGGEVNYEITLKWKKPATSKPPEGQ